MDTPRGTGLDAVVATAEASPLPGTAAVALPAEPAVRLQPVLAGTTVALLFALVYHRTLVTLWDTWMTNDNYSHGFLVPIVSLALIVHDRAALRATPRVPDARGLLLVALGCLVQILGVRADLFALQGWSMLAVLFGIALTFGGGALTKRLAFPIAYLAFMLTFPPLLVNQLSFALKEIAVAISTRMADLFGVLYQRNGMTLYLASGDLRIEHPCSGLRSLLALLALGTLLAARTRASLPRKLVLFACAIPIAIAVNAIRLTLLIVIAHYFGVKAVDGAVHDTSGYLLYALALVLLLGVQRLLAPHRAEPQVQRVAA